MLAPKDHVIAWLREAPPHRVLADRFEIEREAGIGGMGIVYRAVDRSTGNTIALKVLRKTDAASVRRFANEIEVLEGLTDPAIVSYVAHGVLNDGQPYLVMEWIGGESLANRLERGPLTIPESLVLGVRIASALRAAHARGILHRDIKPGNILLPAGHIEDAKVVDFGLSRFVGGPHMTSEGFGIGTPGYAAPEQVRGVDDVDARADLFSLGCLLFRCLTGSEAFEGTEALTVIAKLVLEEPLRVRHLRPEVPPDVEEFIARLLAKSRAERPASAEEVLIALGRLQQGLPPAAVRPSSPSGPSRWSSWWAVAGALAAGMAIVFACFEARARTVTSERAPVQDLPSLPQDFPASPTCRADALLDYREGIHALRDAESERSFAAFARGAAKDPTCPEILLRLFETASYLRPIAEQREYLQRAVVYRDALRERDRIVLDAFVASVGSDPPGLDAAFRIVAEGVRRFPNDAELVELAAMFEIIGSATAKEVEAGLELLDRAIVLDPSSAAVWWMRAWAYDRLGQVEAQADALDRCVKASPGAVLCILQQAVLLRRQGLCDRAEERIRQWIARAPDSSQPYRSLEAVLAAEGAPADAVDEAARLRLAHMARDERESAVLQNIVRLHERAKLAAWTGDFASAIRLGEELERSAADDAQIGSHLRAAWILVDSLLETGQPSEAAVVAERVLRRKVAWTNSPLSGDRGETGSLYFQPIFLGVAVEHGNLSPDAWRASSVAWEHAQGAMNPFEAWVLRWGGATGSRIDAAEAIADEPPVPEEAFLPTLISSFPGLMNAYEGRLRLLAGDATRAAPLLQSAARSCQGTDQPFLNTRAHLWLGVAYETLGDRRAACDAYEVVEHRWGKSTPRSVSAEAAMKRRGALGCGR